MKNKNFPRIITIAGDIENIYGYDVKNKELYIKSKSKMTGMEILPIFVISGAFPASVMNFVEHHSINISPVKWLVLTTVVCVLLSFVLARILLYLSENFFNYRNFEKLEDSKKVEKLYQMQDSKTGEIILIVFAMICGSVGITLAGLYIDSGDAAPLHAGRERRRARDVGRRLGQRAHPHHAGRPPRCRPVRGRSI